MKLRFNNGAIQTCQGNIGVLFIAAGLAQEIFDAPPPALRAEWSAGVDIYSRTPYIETKKGSERMRFIGPNAAKQVYFGEKCPVDIAAKYCDLLKNYRPAKPRNENDDV
jgi:hypothetical protein